MWIIVCDSWIIFKKAICKKIKRELFLKELLVKKLLRVNYWQNNQPVSSSSSLQDLSSSSLSVRLRGDHCILFSFLSRRLALANHVDTWVSVILVMIASMIFSPLVGYGFFMCSYSQAFRVLVDSRVAFLRRTSRPP